MFVKIIITVIPILWVALCGLVLKQSGKDNNIEKMNNVNLGVLTINLILLLLILFFMPLIKTYVDYLLTL